MKILKKILIGIVGFVVLLFLISLFFPTDIRVSRSVEIDASMNKVFDNVNAMGNWQKWGGPWHEEGMDYNEVIQRIEGPTAGVGSKLIYDQGKGDGSVEVIESETNKRVKTLITFADAGHANGEWSFEPGDNATKVTWAIHVELGYNPLKRIVGNLVIGDQVGPLFDIGLGNLKEVSES